MSDNRVRKLVMFYLMIFSGILYLLVLGIWAALRGDIVLSLLDFGMLSVSVVLVLIVRFKDMLNTAVYITLIGFGFFFLVMYTLGSAQQQSFVWYYAYPVITLFLLGEKKGSILCLSLIAATALVYIFQKFIPFYSPYAETMTIRLIFSYLLEYLFVLISETARRKTEEKLSFTMIALQEKAIRDGLTNLYNRRYMDEIWALLIRQNPIIEKDVVFVMIDIDYFKKYNDHYGHQKGDEALKEFTDILMSLIQRKTDYVFRYGGEEFSILLYGANEEKGISFCNNIQQKLEERAIPHIKSSFKRLTVSMGMTIVHSGSKIDAEAIIKTADEALYLAKSAGRNNMKQL